MQQAEGDTLNVVDTEPSVVDTGQLGIGRKPDTVSVLALCRGPDQPEKEGTTTIRQNCEFKRGGKCVTHRIVGTKYVEKTRIWAQRKDGTFGWKPKSTTKYVCQFRDVTKSDVCKDGMDCRLEGVAKSNLLSTGIGLDVQDTALGGPHSYTVGNVDMKRVSGDDYRQAGSIESESLKRGSKGKD